MKRILLCATTLLFWLGLNAVAVAGSFYDLGKNTSTRLAQSVWQDLNHNCIEVDTFLEIITSSSDRASKAIARYAGGNSMEEWGSSYFQGLVSVLETVINHCQAECSAIGVTQGVIAADLFCETSKKLGRVARFLGFEHIISVNCGEQYSARCESTFVTTAICYHSAEKVFFIRKRYRFQEILYGDVPGMLYI